MTRDVTSFLGIDILEGLLRTAVRTVRLTPSKDVELELVNGEIVTATKEAHSA